MANIQELRQKYPQYSDMSDQDFADRFHQKYYSDIPKDEFYSKIGLSSQNNMPSQQNSNPIQDELNYATGMNRTPVDAIRDLLAGGVKGLGKGGEFIANLIPGAPKADVEGLSNLIASKKPSIGGEITKGVGEYAPYGYAGGASLLGQIGAGVASGAATANEGERLQGALTGGALSALPFGLKKGGQLIGSLKNSVNVKSAIEDLMGNLGKGKENTTQATKDITKDIRNAHDMREDEAKIYLEHVKKQAGNEKIYDKPNPLISTAIDKHDKLIKRMEDLNIGDLFESYKKEPTLNNTHNLQSELGVMIGDLSKNPHKTIAQAKEIEDIKSIRDNLKDDLTSYLQKRDLNSNENLAPAYQKGIDLYRENVVPFLSSAKLRDIVRGGKTNVKNVHNIFESPTNVVNRYTKEEEVGPIAKILQDLPQSTKDQILFNKVGGNVNKDSPLKTLNAFNKAKYSGYEHLFNLDIEKQLEDISTKNINKKKLSEYIKKGKNYLAVGGSAATGVGLLNLLRNAYNKGNS